MQKNFVAELRWRGLINDIIPDTEKVLLEGPMNGYIGFDPTSDSLHIGSLVQIIILMHLKLFMQLLNSGKEHLVMLLKLEFMQWLY